MSNQKVQKQFNIPALMFVLGTGFASAAFNINGAFLNYSGWLGFAFGFGVGCLEGIALWSLHTVLVDWNNQHRVKASFAAVLFVAATIGCAMSGKQAFKAMALDAKAQIASEYKRADRIEARANQYFSDARSATDYNERDIANARGEREQAKADKIRAEQDKRQPLSDAMVWLFLALFEGIKAFGIWSLATTTSYKMTKRQIRERAETAARNKADKEAKILNDAARKKAQDDLKVVRPVFSTAA